MRSQLGGATAYSVQLASELDQLLEVLEIGKRRHLEIIYVLAGCGAVHNSTPLAAGREEDLQQQHVADEQKSVATRFRAGVQFYTMAERGCRPRG